MHITEEIHPKNSKGYPGSFPTIYLYNKYRSFDIYLPKLVKDRILGFQNRIDGRISGSIGYHHIYLSIFLPENQ